jgi:hypothetical protein
MLNENEKLFYSFMGNKSGLYLGLIFLTLNFILPFINMLIIKTLIILI